jgi:DNA-binding SARP family transcriptional activator
MEFRLLGPVGVWEAGRQQWIGGRRERTLLAVLLLARGRLVPVHRIVDVLWSEEPPATARRQVHSGMSALRRVVNGRLITLEPGYLLRVEPDELDVQVFESLVATARREASRGDRAAAAQRLRTALGLWRGPALGGVTGMASEATGLEQRRLAALVERVELDLAAGRHANLIGELPALIAEHPFVERLRAQLMLALCRAERPAEALQVYRDARHTLGEQLGVEPSAELDRLKRAILAGETSSVVPARRWPAGAGRPCLLPADIADFTGRAGQVRDLCEALTRATSPVAAVAGDGGVGKTTLAVHVAHRLRSAFPDGQLYADLHGADVAPAVAPGEVLARFLRAMGLDGAAIPDGLDERAELYRERLAGRRMLVLLDNARDEAQVRPLLPGGPGCGVLVTSRARLGGLAGAHAIDLDVLEPGQAVRLLGRIVGQRRLASDLAAATELVRLCGCLPLAVRIVGARLAARPHWRPVDLLRRLDDERRRLDELAHGGLAVRASIALSYRGLEPAARTLFRQLGLLPVAEFASWVCAAVLDTSCAAAEDVAELLVDARLLQAAGPHRYRFHNLVRVYARERAHAEITPAEAAAARRRALGGWLALAERAHRASYGGDHLVVHGGAARWQPDEPVLTDPFDWFETERLSLVAAVRQAAELDLDEYAWDLAHSCLTLFATRWYLDDWRRTQGYAMAAVRRTGNRRGEAAALYGFGSWHDAHGRYRHALRCLSRAAALFEEVGERQGCGMSKAYVSHLARRLGRFGLALSSAEQGRALARAAGDPAGEASALRSAAQTNLALGNLDVAERSLAEALALVKATGNRRDQAQVLHEIGELHLRRGVPEQAELAYNQVLAIVRELGDRIGESFALKGLGLSLTRQDRLGQAEAHLARALELSRASGVRGMEGGVLLEYGELARLQHQHAQAVSRLREAAELWDRLKVPLWQARTLHRLGVAHHEAGDPPAAVSAWRAALRLFLELGTPEAEQVAERLACVLGDKSGAAAAGDPLHNRA